MSPIGGLNFGTFGMCVFGSTRDHDGGVELRSVRSRAQVREITTTTNAKKCLSSHFSKTSDSSLDHKVKGSLCCDPACGSRLAFSGLLWPSSLLDLGLPRRCNQSGFEHHRIIALE